MTRLHKAVNACIMQPVGHVPQCQAQLMQSLWALAFSFWTSGYIPWHKMYQNQDSEYMNHHTYKQRNGGGEGGYGMHGNLSVESVK